MSRFRYTKYTPSPLDDLDIEELLNRLKDFLLESGFPHRSGGGSRSLRSRKDLMRVLAELLSEDENLPDEWREEMRDFAADSRNRISQEVEEFLKQVIRKLVEEGYLKAQTMPAESASEAGVGEEGEAEGPMEFELTGKSVDFLGYKTLRELLSSLGKSSFGAHSTRDLAPGVEAEGHSRPYVFGDALNLDYSSTLLNAVRREGLGLPIQLDYEDLMVHQGEYQSSCATVLMLDCSHSMILYGEDRFTPAKKVALGLAHLIRTQFPGDTLDVVLFHDSAEEVPLVKLPSVKVGPYHTNTREGLRLARRILRNRSKDMRQIVMITDGKPSAVTLPNGRIYKNPFGLDPMILQQTFEEVAQCRKAGILINTFMLAREYYLVEFVKKVSEICHGKAYFTTTLDLAQYILMDFMTKKTRTVH